MTDRRIALLACAMLASFFFPLPSGASGGDVRLRTDDVAEGYYYNALSEAAARYGSLYRGAEFNAGALICGARLRALDQSTITPNVDDYTLVTELRHTDPNHPGYASLFADGLIATADANSLLSCGSSSAAQVQTFGGGAGIDAPGGPFLLTAIQPANHDSDDMNDYCGVVLDTDSPFLNSSRVQSLAPGGERKTIGYNHFLEAIVFEPSLLELHGRMTGSSHFPADRGRPVMFARSGCNLDQFRCVADPGDPGPLTTTDDFITVRLTIDNNGPQASLPMNLVIEADPSPLNSTASKKDVTGLFRSLGGGPGIVNPLVFPSGRTVLTMDIRHALKRRLMRFLPVDVPFELRLEDPNDGIVAASVSQNLGLRPMPGYVDNNSHSGGFGLVQSPAMTGDAIAVTFGRKWWQWGSVLLSGAEVVVGQTGTEVLPGLDAFELRREDPVFAFQPDFSPQGLIRSVGTVGDPGNADGIPGGPAPTTVRIEFPDMSLEGLGGSARGGLGFCRPAAGLVYLNPGDTLLSGTGVGLASGGDVSVATSSILAGGVLPLIPLHESEAELRLDYGDELSGGNDNGGGGNFGPGIRSLRSVTRFRTVTRRD